MPMARKAAISAHPEAGNDQGPNTPTPAVPTAWRGRHTSSQHAQDQEHRRSQFPDRGEILGRRRIRTCVRGGTSDGLIAVWIMIQTMKQPASRKPDEAAVNSWRSRHRPARRR